MKNIWNWIKNNPNRSMFLIPILLVAGISISHVVTWYDMANPINWAIYLSISIEVGALAALIAATNKIKGGIWFMFGIVTLIQMIGNIFFSYKEIDVNGELFKSWVELTGPIWELMGTETTDIVGVKRWLAFLEGGLLPIISLTSLHFFVKYEKPTSVKNTQVEPNEDLTPKMKKTIIEKEKKQYTENEPTDIIFTPTEEFLEGVDSMDEEEGDIVEEVYDGGDEEEWDEDHALDLVMNQMVDELMEEEGLETTDQLIELLEDESIVEDISKENKDKEKDSPVSKQDVTINNKLTKRKMGIDRIK
jgi:hypothetical protein